MTLRSWTILAGALVAVGLGGYGAGRYLTPTRVEVQEKVVFDTRVEYRTLEHEVQVAGPVRVVERIVEKPGERVVERVTETGPTVYIHDQVGAGTSSSSGSSSTSTTTTVDQPRWLLQAGAASGTDLAVGWNVSASRRLAGPLWLGAAWHSERRLELRVGFSF